MPPRASSGVSKPSGSTGRAHNAQGQQSRNIQQMYPLPFSPQYLGRKTLPIKRTDSEPLNRADIQYDLLYFIFANPTRCFIDEMAPGKPMVLRDKMVDTPEFAIEFAKIALLTNVGRINTTMAFFPEMKTALRSYHPVPSLQKTDGNLQDAPRIKNCLKAALLPWEFKATPPATPQEVREKTRTGAVPPTSVVNLIFVLSSANNAQYLAQTHFDPPVEFLDLFLPISISSASRANAFLWLMFHYLSAPGTPNPFDDAYSRANHLKVPRLHSLTREEMYQENRDTAEEIEWGRQMSALRSKFLKELVDEMYAEKERKRNQPLPSPLAPSGSISEQDLSVIRSRSRMTVSEEGSRAPSSGSDMPALRPAPPPPPPPHVPIFVPIAPRIPQPGVEAQAEGSAQERTMLERVLSSSSHASSPYRLQPIPPDAWHINKNVDPLDDSDAEGDEHVRLDYMRRLRILSRLRGKDPTPPPDQPPSRTQTQGPSQEHTVYTHQMQVQPQPPIQASNFSSRTRSSQDPGGQAYQMSSWQP